MNYELKGLVYSHPEYLMLVTTELQRFFGAELYTLKQHFGVSDTQKANEIGDGFNNMIAVFQQRYYNQMVPYESEMYQGLNVDMLNDVRKKLADIIMGCVAETVSWYGGAGAGGVTDYLRLNAETDAEEGSEDRIRIACVEVLVYHKILELAKAKGFYNDDWRLINVEALYDKNHEFTVEQLIDNQGWQLSRINYSFLVLISLVNVVCMKQYHYDADAKLRSAIFDVVSCLRDRRIELMSALAMNYRDMKMLDKVAKVAADNVLISSRDGGGAVFSVTHLATSSGYYPNSWLSEQSERLEALIRKICM